jgi:CheY-like chemotaxis protein
MSEVAKRVLVAEDNPSFAHVISFVLRKAGFEMTLARNGNEAWENAQDGDFDIIVLDNKMPGMTGVELCQRLRSLPRHYETPIVMVTSCQLDLDVERLERQFHVAAVLPKPYSPRELIRTIERFLLPDRARPPAGQRSL